MTASRYFEGHGFIKASPELPVVIELADDIKPGPDMREIDKDGKVVGGPLMSAQFAVRAGAGQGDMVTKPFDATEKRASSQHDGIEYREEGKRVKDQPAQVDANVVSVQRTGEAPKGEDVGATDASRKAAADKHHRASDKKVI